MPRRIEVKIYIDDYDVTTQMTPSLWESVTIKKLKDAGVPIRGENLYELTSGTLTRFDDPKDFGACSYVWEA